MAELLVVIATIAIRVTPLLPALSGPKPARCTVMGRSASVPEHFLALAKQERLGVTQRPGQTMVGEQ